MMTMTHKSQTTNDVLEEKRGRAEGEQAPVVAEKDRLQVLVGELLKENQALRFKVAHLEQQVASAERGLENATKWAGLVL
jgi:hypothetical protein